MKLTKTQKRVLATIAKNTPLQGDTRTIVSLEKKGLIRKVERNITFWTLTDTGEELYRKVFNITPECW